VEIYGGIKFTGAVSLEKTGRVKLKRSRTFLITSKFICGVEDKPMPSGGKFKL
jgi:hypothetical protein